MVYHQNDRKADHAILDGLVGKCTLFVLDKQPYYPMLKYTIIYPSRIGLFWKFLKAKVNNFAEYLCLQCLNCAHFACCQFEQALQLSTCHEEPKKMQLKTILIHIKSYKFMARFL
jgi:hypothetical protein